MTNDLKTQYQEVLKRIKNGETVSIACKQVGMKVWAFYGAKKTFAPKTRAKRTAKIVVQDVPMTLPVNRLYMLVGTPSELAAFIGAQ